MSAVVKPRLGFRDGKPASSFPRGCASRIEKRPGTSGKLRKRTFRWRMGPHLDWSLASEAHRPVMFRDLPEDLEAFGDCHPTVIDDEFASLEHPPVRAGLRHLTDFA